MVGHRHTGSILSDALAPGRVSVRCRTLGGPAGGGLLCVHQTTNGWQELTTMLGAGGCIAWTPYGRSPTRYVGATSAIRGQSSLHLRGGSDFARLAASLGLLGPGPDGPWRQTIMAEILRS
eukprot:5544777-Amphidinium_carterae.4